MPRLSPTVKIAFGLVSLTISILLLGQLVGFIPDEDKYALDARQKLCESLAIQISIMATKNDFTSIKGVLENIVKRNDDILSSALIAKVGRPIIVGEHKQHWANRHTKRSTSTNVQVPILSNKRHFGTLEMSFKEINHGTALSPGTLSGLLLFVALLGFVLYLLFIKRAMQELDPNAVIPERVRSAFDALSEGLIIMDENSRIILANEAFTHKTGIRQKRLIGALANNMRWQRRESDSDAGIYPWQASMQNHQRNMSAPMHMQLEDGSKISFSVNTAPIYDHKDKPRGVIATFDDMTDLENKHRDLQSVLKKLRTSERALLDKTVELEFLASRDPLTDCFNRRTFFEHYNKIYDTAIRDGHGLVFIMADIDHFKLINDEYGHTSGDAVITFVAEILSTNSRPEDIVGRYGGEEFALIMPNANLEQAMTIAERLRMEIERRGYELFKNERTVNSSFGVAHLSADIDDPLELINRADHALYSAKETGRNRVISWSPEINETRENQDTKQKESSIQHLESTDSSYEKHVLKEEIQRLEDTVWMLEAQLKYGRNEAKRHTSKDKLTDLPNRVIFMDRASKALTVCKQKDGLAALLSIDIDGFNTINEAFGYAIGNQLLKLTASRLSDIFQKIDSTTILNGQQSHNISRINSDEFALLLTTQSDTLDASGIAKIIMDGLNQDVVIDGHEIFTTYSIGIALYPINDHTADGLLQKANAARRVAKKQDGGNHINLFSDDIKRSAYRKVWLENQLQKAIAQSQFRLKYQPIVDLKSGHITTMEALTTWPHPKFGHIDPDEFIQIAEQTGLIHQIGEWVLRTACIDLQKWHTAGFTDLNIAINLSAIQLHQENLAQKIMEQCIEFTIDPAHIYLELTKQSLIEESDTAIKVMQHISDTGIQFTLDNFGKGSSSLGYLSHLPINCIKIDQSFFTTTIPDELNKTILRSIIALAKSLDLHVIANGINTEAYRELLTDLGCNEGQGSLYAAPLSWEKADEMLTNTNKKRLGRKISTKPS